MQKLKSSNQRGFTIIEVLIVLAIAGLIMLIVFLAVPALQRNQRNTSRKSDVSRIGGASTEFLSNNNGTLPSTTADATSILTSAGTLAQYQLTAGTSFTIATGVQSAITDPSKVVLVTGAQCGTSGATVAGQPRQMAVQYAVENGNSTATTNGTSVCTNI